jgi:hypothetical protein
MSIIKIANDIMQKQPGWAQRHPWVSEGLALTGGIAAADAALHGWGARNQGLKAIGQHALKGLGEGAAYGAILGTVEPVILHKALRKPQGNPV